MRDGVHQRGSAREKIDATRVRLQVDAHLVVPGFLQEQDADHQCQCLAQPVVEELLHARDEFALAAREVMVGARDFDLRRALECF